MDLCPHSLFEVPAANCTICIDGPAISRPKKPKRAKAKMPIAVDLFSLKVEKILSGVWCAKCDAPIEKRHGCECTRRELMAQDHAAILAWENEHIEEPSARFAAFSALRRTALRAVGSVQDDYRGTTLGHSIACGGVSKWTLPKVTTADDFPV